MKNSVYILAPFVYLHGCGVPSETYCINGDSTSVIVYKANPSALDGHEYTVCLMTNERCDSYNRLVAERPNYLEISVAGKNVLIQQMGGSVKMFASDPLGMRDANYEKSGKLFLTYTHARNGRTGVHINVDSRSETLIPCKLR
jgi:hypothetical protein